MVKQLFANNIITTVSTQLEIGGTSLVVADATGMPAPGANEYFLATLYSIVGGVEVNHEVVKCTGRTGASLTVERAQEGTTAQQWVVGSRVELRGTAGSLEKLRDAVWPVPVSRGVNFNIVMGTVYRVTAGGITMTLPASIAQDEWVGFIPAADLAASTVAIARNGHLIAGAAEDFIWDMRRGFRLVYDATSGLEVV